jgi:hypothetical protein
VALSGTLSNVVDVCGPATKVEVTASINVYLYGGKPPPDWVVTLITPVLLPEQEAVAAVIVAAVNAAGGLMLTVVIDVFPQISVTLTVCDGVPAKGVMVEKILADCGPAIQVVFVASYTAKV